jgi:L-rhamnose isomerase
VIPKSNAGLRAPSLHKQSKPQAIDRDYRIAKERYAETGVDIDQAIHQLSRIPISLQCWQGDDVGGFEQAGSPPGGGLAVTGNYPGKARTAEELRRDAKKALSLIPGRHRFNLHASYADPGNQRVDRDELEVGQFLHWIDWARSSGIGLDFNPTYFAHPMAESGFTLSHADSGIRNFWIRHGIACRRIGAAMGKALGTPCVTNLWIPDGMKDTPIDRRGPRERLLRALDEIYTPRINSKHNLDAVEGKLFGIGSESYTAGSHEFYLGYAITRHKLVCLDAGHYHPTEVLADKLSAVFPYVDRLLLHVSRGVRWDSDHVVILNDEVQSLASELVRGDYLGRTHLGLDYFDASINRVAAWVIGARSLLKALLIALLEPLDRLRRAEREADYTSRLALLEEVKTLPVGAVWDSYCLQQDVPVGEAWLADIHQYETHELSKRT